MDWHEIGTSRWSYGWADGVTYLVAVFDREVRLTRFRLPFASDGDAEQLELAAEAVRNVITFPLGRGPGRPGGEPELAALAESAKTFAERYEAGESLEGYPAWRHERPEPAFRLREGESVRFIGEPPEPFPRQAGPGEFGTSHVYGTQPGCCAPEPSVQRHFHEPFEAERECRELHELAAEDLLADLRAADGHVPDYNRAEADRRLSAARFLATGDADD